MSVYAPTRPQKGNSLLTFPTDYVVIDIETTGLDPKFDEIIELSALRVHAGEICSRFTSFVKPENEISSFITELTGITNSDVADAPAIGSILPDFLDFIVSDIIVGHNVHFDLNFIYDAAMEHCGRPVSNDIVDTMRIARHVLPQLKHRRLEDVASALGVVPGGAHRALVDCETTHSVLQALRATADSSGIDLSLLFKIATRGVKAADITAETGNEQPDSPLFGKVCVFTGMLEKMTRKEAMQIVTNMGGTCGDIVTAKTNYLILGNNDYCTTIKDGKSTKQKKAESLILNGSDLQILSESVFYDMISEYSTAGASNTESAPKKSRKVDTFGCCSRYEACSDAKKCVHPDPTFATSCQYRKNLQAGRIFYGKNKKTP